MSSLMVLLLMAGAVLLTVILTELFKKLDKKGKLKGYRVWVPFLLSAFFAFLFWQGAFFAGREIWTCWVIIFGISVFFYEAILKKIKEFKLKKR